MILPDDTWPGFRSLLHVLEINANSFLAATTYLARLHSAVATLEARDELVVSGTGTVVSAGLESFIAEARNLGANLSVMAAERLVGKLNENPIILTIADLTRDLWEIESRLSDHLISVKLFALSEGEAIYLQSGQHLLDAVVLERYPGIVFEMEEASKCLVLGRATASAFHAMRAVEVMLGALRKFLEIPDPESAAGRNWGIVLGTIKAKIDEKYPAKTRKGGSIGSKAEALYATLDAIKSPWRNATMHVETTYQPFEAEHILKCVNVLSVRMAEVCDEEGRPILEATTLT